MFPFDLWHRRRERPLLALLFVESFLVTLIATGMAWLVFSAAAGLIAVFLICVGTQDSFLTLLEANRRDIWEGRLGPYSANAWLVTSLITVFLGAFFAFSAVAWLLPAPLMRVVFSSQLQLSPVDAFELEQLHFGAFDVLFVHNLGVFTLAVVISAVFRTGGALLILCWNASVWALTYAYLSRLSILFGGASSAKTLAAVSLGITPHLVLEAAAYISGTMVGIFSAKAVEKYKWHDPRFSRVIVASLALVGVGVALLVVAAWVESGWPAYCIELLLGEG